MQVGHAGDHVDYDHTGKVRNTWKDHISHGIERCYALHPQKGMVFCTMLRGHIGPHRDVLQGSHTVWPRYPGELQVVRHMLPSPEPDQKVVEITLENEIGDDSSLLDWAKSKNPKLFKTKGRDAASDNCRTANKDLHERCTEPWCECPCHDSLGRRQRSPWGICLGVLAFLTTIGGRL